MINYVKKLKGVTTPIATRYKPLFKEGERTRTYAGENPDVLVDGIWYNSTNGAEKVTNGTFADGTTTGWSNFNATLSVSSGTLRITDNGANSRAYQAISTVVGTSYKVTFAVNTNSGGFNSYFGLEETMPTTATAYKRDLTITSTSSYEIEFTANSTTTYLYFEQEGTGYLEVDNITMFESEIVPDTAYVTEQTYYPFEVVLNDEGQKVDLIPFDVPTLVEDSLLVETIKVLGNRKIIELGTIYNNNRYVIDWSEVDLPVDSSNFNSCETKVEIFANNMWSGTGKAYNGGGQGCDAYSNSEGIVVQTGSVSLLSANSNDYIDGFGNVGSTITSAKARVIVTYVGEAKNV